ncbi:MAG: IS66 family insertion sequence element accessory protein TnpB [Chloroflexota bacterium]
MLIAPSRRVFVAADPVDFHFSFDRLAGVVRNALRADPLSGDLFAFFNRARTHCKILVFEPGGYAIYYKRLERGSFELPVISGEATRVEVDASTLAMILDGIDLRAPRRLRYTLDRGKNVLPES